MVLNGLNSSYLQSSLNHLTKTGGKPLKDVKPPLKTLVGASEKGFLEKNAWASISRLQSVSEGPVQETLGRSLSQTSILDLSTDLAPKVKYKILLPQQTGDLIFSEVRHEEHDSAVSVIDGYGAVEVTTASHRKVGLRLKSTDDFQKADEAWGVVEDHGSRVSAALGGSRVYAVKDADGSITFSHNDRANLGDIEDFLEAVQKAALGEGKVSPDPSAVSQFILRGITEAQLSEVKANLAKSHEDLKALNTDVEKLRAALSEVGNEEAKALKEKIVAANFKHLGIKLQLEIEEDNSLNLFVVRDVEGRLNQQRLEEYIKGFEFVLEGFDSRFQANAEIERVEVEKPGLTLAESILGDSDARSAQDVLDTAVAHMIGQRETFTPLLQQEFKSLVNGGYQGFSQFGEDIERSMAAFTQRKRNIGLTNESPQKIDDELENWVGKNVESIVSAYSADNTVLSLTMLRAIAESSDVTIRVFDSAGAGSPTSLTYGSGDADHAVFLDFNSGVITPAKQTITYVAHREAPTSDETARALMAVKTRDSIDVIKAAKVALSESAPELSKLNYEAAVDRRIGRLERQLASTGDFTLASLQNGRLVLVKNEAAELLTRYESKVKDYKAMPTAFNKERVAELEAHILREELSNVLLTQQSTLSAENVKKYSNLSTRFNTALPWLGAVTRVGSVKLSDIPVVIDTNSAHMFHDATSISDSKLKRMTPVLEVLKDAKNNNIDLGEIEFGIKSRSGFKIRNESVRFLLDIGDESEALRLPELQDRISKLNDKIKEAEAPFIENIEKIYRRRDKSSAKFVSQREALVEKRKAASKKLREDLMVIKKEAKKCAAKLKNIRKNLASSLAKLGHVSEFKVSTEDLVEVAAKLKAHSLQSGVEAASENLSYLRSELSAQPEVSDYAAEQLVFNSLAEAGLFSGKLSAHDTRVLGSLHSQLLGLNIISRVSDEKGRSTFVVASPVDPAKNKALKARLLQIGKESGLTLEKSAELVSFLSSKHVSNIEEGASSLLEIPGIGAQSASLEKKMKAVEALLVDRGAIRISEDGEKKLEVLVDPVDVVKTLYSLVKRVKGRQRLSNSQVDKIVGFLEDKYQLQQTKAGLEALSKAVVFAAENGCHIVLEEHRSEPVFDIRHPFLPVEQVLKGKEKALSAVKAGLDKASKASSSSDFIVRNGVSMFNIPSTVVPPRVEVLKVKSMRDLKAKTQEAANLNHSAILLESPKGMRLFIPGLEPDVVKSVEDAVERLVGRTGSVYVSLHKGDRYETDKYESGYFYGVRITEKNVDLSTVEGVSPILPPSALKSGLFMAGFVGAGLLVGGGTGYYNVLRQGTLVENYQKFKEWKENPEGDDVYVDRASGAIFSRADVENPEIWGSSLHDISPVFHAQTLSSLYTLSSVGVALYGAASGSKVLTAAGFLGFLHSTGIPAGANAEGLRGAPRILQSSQLSIHGFVKDAAYQGIHSGTPVPTTITKLKAFYDVLNSTTPLDPLPEYDSGTATVAQQNSYYQTLHEAVLKGWQSDLTESQRSTIRTSLYVATGGRFGDGIQLDVTLKENNVDSINENCVYPYDYAALNVTDAETYASLVTGYASSQFNSSSLTGEFAVIDGQYGTMYMGESLFNPDEGAFSVGTITMPSCATYSDRPVNTGDYDVVVDDDGGDNVDDDVVVNDDGADNVDDGGNTGSGLNSQMFGPAYEAALKSGNPEWAKRLPGDTGTAISTHLSALGSLMGEHAERLDGLGDRCYNVYGFNITDVSNSTFSGLSADELSGLVIEGEVLQYCIQNHPVMVAKQMPGLSFPQFSGVETTETLDANSTSTKDLSVLAKVSALRKWYEAPSTQRELFAAKTIVLDYNRTLTETNMKLPGAQVLVNYTSDTSYRAAEQRVGQVLDAQALLLANPGLVDHIGNSVLKADIDAVFPRGFYAAVNATRNTDSLIRIADNVDVFHSAVSKYQASLAVADVPLNTALVTYGGHLNVSYDKVCPDCTESDIPELVQTSAQYSTVRNGLNGWLESDYNANRLDGASSYADIMAAKSHEDVCKLNLTSVQLSIDELNMQAGDGASLAYEIANFELEYPGYLNIYLNGNTLEYLQGAGISVSSLGRNTTVVAGEAASLSTTFKSDYLAISKTRASYIEAMEKAKMLAKMVELIPTISIDSSDGIFVDQEMLDALLAFQVSPSSHTAENVLKYSSEILATDSAAMAALGSKVTTLQDSVSSLRDRVFQFENSTAYDSALKELTTLVGVDADAFCPDCTSENYTSVVEAKAKFQGYAPRLSKYPKALYNLYKISSAHGYESALNPTTLESLKLVNSTLVHISMDRVDYVVNQGAIFARKIIDFDAANPGFARFFLPYEVISYLSEAKYELGTYYGDSRATDSGQLGEQPLDLMTQYAGIYKFSSDISTALENAQKLADMITLFPSFNAVDGVVNPADGIPQEVYNKLVSFQASPHSVDVQEIVGDDSSYVERFDNPAVLAMYQVDNDHETRLATVEATQASAATDTLIKNFAIRIGSKNGTDDFAGLTDANYTQLLTDYDAMGHLLYSVGTIPSELYNLTASMVKDAPKLDAIKSADTYAKVRRLNMGEAHRVVSLANARVARGRDALEKAIYVDVKYTGHARYVLNETEVEAYNSAGYTLGDIGRGSYTAGVVNRSQKDFQTHYAKLADIASELSDKLDSAVKLGRMVTLLDSIPVNETTEEPLKVTGVSAEALTAVKSYVNSPSIDTARKALKTDYVKEFLDFESPTIASLRAGLQSVELTVSGLSSDVSALENSMTLDVLKETVAYKLGGEVDSVFNGTDITNANYTQLAAVNHRLDRYEYVFRSISGKEFNDRLVGKSPKYENLKGIKTYAEFTAQNLNAVDQTIENIFELVGQGGSLVAEIISSDTSNPGLVGLFLSEEAKGFVDGLYTLGSYSSGGVVTNGTVLAVKPEGYMSKQLGVETVRSNIEAAVTKAGQLAEILSAYPLLTNTSLVGEEAYAAAKAFIADPDRVSPDTVLNYYTLFKTSVDPVVLKIDERVGGIEVDLSEVRLEIGDTPTTVVESSFAALIDQEDVGKVFSNSSASFAEKSVVYQQLLNLKPGLSDMTEAVFTKYAVEGSPSFHELKTISDFNNATSLNLTAAQATVEEFYRHAQEGFNLVKSVMETDMAYPGYASRVLSDSEKELISRCGVVLASFNQTGYLTPSSTSKVSPDVKLRYEALLDVSDSIKSRLTFAENAARVIALVDNIELDSDGAPLSRFRISKTQYELAKALKDNRDSRIVPFELEDSVVDAFLKYESTALRALGEAVTDLEVARSDSDFAFQKFVNESSYSVLVELFSDTMGAKDYSVAFNGTSLKDRRLIADGFSKYNEFKAATEAMPDDVYNARSYPGAPELVAFRSVSTYADFLEQNVTAGLAKVDYIKNEIAMGGRVVDRVIETDATYPGMLNFFVTSEVSGALQRSGYTLGTYGVNGTVTAGVTDAVIPDGYQLEHLTLASNNVDVATSITQATQLGEMLAAFEGERNADGSLKQGSVLDSSIFEHLSSFVAAPSSRNIQAVLEHHDAVMLATSSKFVGLTRQVSEHAGNISTLFALQEGSDFRNLRASYRLVVNNTNPEVDVLAGYTEADQVDIFHTMQILYQIKDFCDRFDNATYSEYKLPSSPSFEELSNMFSGTFTHAQAKAMKLDLAKESFNNVDKAASAGSLRFQDIKAFNEQTPGYLGYFLPASSKAAAEKLGVSFGTLGTGLNVTEGTPTEVQAKPNLQYLTILREQNDVKDAIADATDFHDMMLIYPHIKVGNDSLPLASENIPEEAYTRMKSWIESLPGSSVRDVSTPQEILEYKQQVLAYSDVVVSDLRSSLLSISEDAKLTNLDVHNLSQKFNETMEIVLSLNATQSSFGTRIDNIQDYTARFAAVLASYQQGDLSYKEYLILVSAFFQDSGGVARRNLGEVDASSFTLNPKKLKMFAKIPLSSGRALTDGRTDPGDDDVDVGDGSTDEFFQALKKFVSTEQRSETNKEDLRNIVDFRDTKVLIGAGGLGVVALTGAALGLKSLRQSQQDAGEMRSALQIVDAAFMSDVYKLAGTLDEDNGSIVVKGGLLERQLVKNEGESAPSLKESRRVVHPATLKASHIVQEVSYDTVEVIFPQERGITAAAAASIPGLEVIPGKREMRNYTIGGKLEEETEISVSIHRITTRGGITKQNATEALNYTMDAYYKMLKEYPDANFTSSNPAQYRLMPLAMRSDADRVGPPALNLHHLGAQWTIFNHPRPLTHSDEANLRLYLQKGTGGRSINSDSHSLKTGTGGGSINSDLHSESKSDLHSESKSDLHSESKSDSHSESKSDSPSESRSHSHSESKSDSPSESRSHSHSEFEKKENSALNPDNITFQSPISSNSELNSFEGSSRNLDLSKVSRKSGTFIFKPNFFRGAKIKTLQEYSKLATKLDHDVSNTSDFAVPFLQEDPFESINSGNELRIELWGSVDITDILDELKDANVAFNYSDQGDALGTNKHILSMESTGNKLFTASYPVKLAKSLAVLYTVKAPKKPQEEVVVRRILERLYAAYKINGGSKPTPELLEALNIDQPNLRMKRVSCCSKQSLQQDELSSGDTYSKEPSNNSTLTLADYNALQLLESQGKSVHKGWVELLKNPKFKRQENNVNALILSGKISVQKGNSKSTSTKQGNQANQANMVPAL